MGKKKSTFPKKKPKLEIVFDEKKRKEFLTGFRKRKNERRKKAKVEMEEMFKAERKRIRQEVKDNVNTFKKSYAPLPTEDDILKEDEYEEEEVTIKVIELSTKDMAEQRIGLGENTAKYSDCEQSDHSESENVEKDVNDIPGMSLTLPKKKNKEKQNGLPKAKAATTKKELDRLTQKKTLKSIQKSKVFKMKERLNKAENKKRAKRDKNTEIRQLKSQGRRIEKKPDFKRLNKLRGKNPHKRKR